MNATQIAQVLAALFPDGVYGALLALLVFAVRQLAAPVRAYLTLHYTARQLAEARVIAAEVARAIEQVTATWLKANPDKAITGRRKLDQAIYEANVLARSVGISLTDEQWRSLFEAVVYTMHQEVDATTVAAPMPPSAPAPITTPSAPPFVPPPAMFAQT